MGAHVVEGEFQSDKYPTCPRGKVPLSVRDPTAQDLLWEYAQRRRTVDSEFSDDLEASLRTAGYDPTGFVLGRQGQQGLSGSLVLSTGTAVPVRVALNLPALTRAEQRELWHVRVPLHDLTHRPVTGETAKIGPMKVGEPLDGVEIVALGTRCPVHSGMIHGGEAEELRVGIERILEGDDKGVRIRLQRLLDSVDARDSLGHLEGSFQETK